MAEVKVNKLDLDKTAAAKKPSKTQRSRSNDKAKKAVLKSRKSSQSRSNSRSTSRTRNASSKTNTLGAKVLTKKELAKKESSEAAAPAPARRSLRSSSQQSNQESLSSRAAETAANLGNINEEHHASASVSITEMIADAQKSSTTTTTTNRYDLRRRATTPPESKSIHVKVLPSSRPSQANGSMCQRLRTFKFCSFLNRCYESGYLRFTIKQLFQILIASILLVISLSIINYFNLFDLAALRGKLNYQSIVANLNECRSRSWQWLQNVPNSFLSFFKQR